MSTFINAGTTCRCSFGSAPCTLNVPPANKAMACGVPTATIMDTKAFNLPTFGMCSSLANPAVSGASPPGGVTPKPCQPLITGPWTPGSATVAVGNIPALTDNSKAMCNWAGVIEIVAAGQQTVKLA